ncbi:MAG: hypothetical protein KAX19_04825 [Candidatus Brocadiae bacterium]|nr:hypothetical protein [Candidatus Brocadiia bacterium]
MDLSEPLATVPMNHPAGVTRYTWQSAPLTDGEEYRFAIRIAAIPWRRVLGTQNTDEHAATADSDAPTAPVLAAQVI